MVIKKLILLCFINFVLLTTLYAQQIGDTIVIETFNYSQTYGVNQWSPGIRDTMIDFSVLPDVSFEKVLMSYNIRCKDGNVSSPISGQTDVGCGEWDISCNTYLHDESSIDSVPFTHPDYTISGFSGPIFTYSTLPSYTYYQYTQKDVTINNVIDETVGTLSGGSTALENVISVQNRSGKSQYLLSASELQNTGLVAGELTGLRLNVLDGESTASFLRIRLKNTTSSVLDPTAVDLNGFSEVYFKDFTAGAGETHFQFAESFDWDGVSNVILELNFTSRLTHDPIQFEGETAVGGSALTSNKTDLYAEFAGAEQYIDLPDAETDFSNGLTISAWVNYDNFNHWSRIIDFGNGPNSDNILLANQGTSSSLVLSTRIGGNSSRVTADDVLVTGEWIHIAASIDADGIAVIYFNGAVVASGDVHIPSTLLRTNNFIGRSNWNNDAYFDGKMDEIALWNASLTQDEIRDWMYKDIDASHPQFDNLVFAFNFNEANDSQVVDISVNEIVGTKMNYVPSLLFDGRAIFKNIPETSLRPNISIVQGTYTQTVTDIIVLDSLQNAPNVVTNYEIISNPGIIMDDEVNPISINNYWEAVSQSIFDAETEELLTTIPVEAEGNIIAVDLEYYRRWPSKIEIMSFVTPYGINLDLGPNGKTWTFDMTDYLPIFKDSKRMTIERGGQWMEDMDIRFMFIVGTPPRDVMDISQIWRPESRPYTQIINNRYFPSREVVLDPNASAFKVRTAVSGHGQEGEFIPRQHFMDVNGGSNEFIWDVWKECADNPIYPQGGTWVYDRAGWCPGAPTDVQHSDITPFVSPGETITLDYGVQTASGSSNYIVNSQLVTYGAPNHSLDARIIEVREPSNRVEFTRFNSICHTPKVVIQNAGSTPLTSMNINYWVNNATTPLTYEWVGNLDFMETEEVHLPSLPELWSPANLSNNVFHVELSAPNGVTDEYIYNDHYRSTFELPEILPNAIVIHFRTNNAPFESSYQVVDEGGNTILSRSNMSGNTLYIDTLELGMGCYTYRVNDSGGDGLSWWANNDGNGYTRIFEVGGGLIQNFNGDFGDNINFNFSVDLPLSYEDLPHEALDINLYPNPAHSSFIIEGQNLLGTQIDLFNNLGIRMKVSFNHSPSMIEVDITDLPGGIYLVRIEQDGKVETKKLVVE